MGKLQTGRFERLSTRTYGMKGPGAMVDMDETVLGVVLLERQGGLESHLIQEWETYGIVQSRGSNAGQFSWILISNPVDSHRLIVVDMWMRNNATPMEVYITRGVPPGFVAGTVGEPLDTRMATAKEPTARVFSLLSNIGGFGQVIMLPTTTDLIRYPVLLAPDGSLVWRSGATDETMVISMRWAERDAAPFELQ